MDRVAIVTGASSGIGMATARRLARDGFSVLAVGRVEQTLAAVCADIKANGGRAEPFAADVTSEEGPRAIVSCAERTLGGIDALVNAAGIIASGAVAATSDADWDTMMSVNVRAPFRLIREASASLMSRRGAVVNVSSVNGLRSFAGVLAYCVSKAGLDHLTRCAALEMAPFGVRVNAVNPGVTVTNLHRRGGMDPEQYGKFLERSKETHPLGRPGQPDEIASMVLYLASERAAWMTGETIPIDGGRHLTCLR